MQTNALIECRRGEIAPFLSPQESCSAALRRSRLIPSIYAALLCWWRLGCGLLRAVLRVSGLGLLVAAAAADAAIVRLTTNPTAAALARSRATWFHRWSTVACWVLGLEIERHGFVPVSGLVVVNELSFIDALLLASLTPLVFVVDRGVRCRPIIGSVARSGGHPLPRPQAAE